MGDNDHFQRVHVEEEQPDPLENYLRQWGLEIYIPDFKEHAIDLDTLQMLSENDIKELIPIIGHRAKLTTQINLLKQLTGQSNSLCEGQSSLSQSVINFVLDSDDPILDNYRVEPENTTEEPHNNQRELENLETTHSPDTSCELYKTLSMCNEGKSLLLTYQQSGLLNNAARRRLCNLIIGHELKDNPDKKLTSSRLYQLAYEISKIFKKENSSVYFIPFMCYNPKQRTSAKGKLLDCYRQRRREFIKSGIAETSKQRPSSSTSSGTESPQPISRSCQIQEAVDKLEESNEDIDEKLQWLRNCCDPWDTVELYWNITAKIRLTKLTTTETTVQDYLHEFKALSQPGGVFLLLKDFKNLYPLINDNLYQNWPQINANIIEHASKRPEAGLKDITKEILKYNNF